VEYDIDETSSNDILREIIGLGFAAEVKIECARRKQFAYLSLSQTSFYFFQESSENCQSCEKRKQDSYCKTSMTTLNVRYISRPELVRKFVHDITTFIVKRKPNDNCRFFSALCGFMQ